MSQIAYSLTGSFNIRQPLQYVAHSAIDNSPTASPVFIAAAIVGEVRPRIDNTMVDVRQLCSANLYDQVTTSLDFGFGFNLNPFNLPLLKYGSEPPNYTTPAGTSAEYLTFVLPYKQSVGAGLVDHWLFFQGSKMNTLEMSVTPQGLVDATTEWLCRDIPTPTAAANGGLTTPTFVDCSAVTSAPLSHVDNGPTPLTMDGVQYPCTSWRQTWNNNLIPTRANGSSKLDALTVGIREFTGSATIPVGKNLNLENKIREVQQTAVAAEYVYKTGVMVSNITKLKIQNYAPVYSASANEVWAYEFTWKAQSADLATS